MKTTTITCCALLLSASLAVQANPITRAEARIVAQQLVGINDTSSDDGAPLASYYIFSRGAGQGFVIVSGDDSTAPIIGYTEQGDYDLAALPPQLQSMLRGWGERVTEVQRRPQQQVHRLSAPRRAIAAYKSEWTDVSPLLKTHWHQDAPYNILAPLKNGQHCMTGCVATAGSQVTYYYHKDNPSELAYDTPTYSYGTPITVSLPKGTPIEWDQMKLKGSGTARQDSAVAKLMYALGTSAWLTYGDGEGLATSGYNSNMAEAMKGHFNLSYSYKSKSESSQQAWEELIYKNLAAKKPMLYSGYKDEQTGGHSVCLDGYQARTGLYHFNFGWGGQGDGYYTVDDETGMNGFNSYQDLVYNITPLKQNLAVEIITDKIFHKAASDVEVVVTNNGTLDYHGISIYANTKPVATGTLVVNDKETLLEPGKTVSMNYSLTTTQKDSIYIVVCDKSRRVIATKMVQILQTVADLHLSDITVDAGAAVTNVDGIDFRHVNNTTATVTVTLTNTTDGTYCQPNMQCYLEEYETETKEWTDAKCIYHSNYTFDVGQTRLVDFKFMGLSEGVLYRAYLKDKAIASVQSDIIIDTDEPYTYFTILKPDLAIVIDGRNATVTGHWNAALFKQKATDASVCSYDISGLAELNEKPIAANPNALFYTTAENTNLAGMENIVVGDVCQHLTIQTAADFKPLRPFTARQASLTLTEAEPGKWHTALIPFAAEVPYGMQMKQAKEYTTQGLATISHVFTRNVEAMNIVTFLTSRPELNTITATDVVFGDLQSTVYADTVAMFFDGILRAYTVSTPLEPNSLVPGQYISSLYFIAPTADQTTVDAFMPVVVGASSERVRTTSETLVDGYYRTLSSTIAKAYNVLTSYPSPLTPRLSLLDEVKVAEDMLTYRSHVENTDVKDENTTLEKAINTFLEAAATTITGDVNGDGSVDVADIATIIDVMAGNGQSSMEGVLSPADVNGDGSVDVADIATVIDIMAGNVM